MAYAKIIFENPRTGRVRTAPVGFSWTVSFFGPFPALLRGDWKWTVIMGLLALITGGISSMIFMFLYNKTYIQELIASDFQARSVEGSDFDTVAAELDITIPRLQADEARMR